LADLAGFATLGCIISNNWGRGSHIASSERFEVGLQAFVKHLFLCEIDRLGEILVKWDRKIDPRQYKASTRDQNSCGQSN